MSRTAPGDLPSPEELRGVAARLGQAHVPEQPRPSGRPLDELIATILSQHTSDRNSQLALARLKARFPRWSEALAAGEPAIAEAIRPGGLAAPKAAWIVALLRALPQDQAGEPTLDHLRQLEPAEAFRLLDSYAGVGPKTAACTLLFAFNWPAFPVDVHVHRIARRLGWSGATEPADRFQLRLMEVVPAEVTYQLHMGMVRHGRLVCRPARPACAECVLADRCRQGPRRGEGAPIARREV